MKKFNLSQIMKNAWRMVKTASMTISAALRKAWAIAKESVNMATLKGSEKQIAWATEIRNTVKDIMNQFIDMAAQMPAHPTKDANVAYIKERLAALDDCQSASAIIDCFKGIRRTGDINEDIPSLLSVYRIKAATSAALHALLCR